MEATPTTSAASAIAMPANATLIHDVASWLADASIVWQHKPSDDNEQYKVVRDQRMEAFASIVSGYSRATLQRMTDDKFTTPEQSLIADSILMHMETEEVINDIISFREFIMNSGLLGFPTQRSIYLRGICQYEGIEPISDGGYPQRRADQGLAILRITEHLKHHGIQNEGVKTADRKNYARIAAPEMRELIMTSDEPLELADIIVSRGFTSAAEVTAFLEATDGIAAPVQSGAL